MRLAPPGILLGGARYCQDRCLEQALADALFRIQSAPQKKPKRHRIPLGLILISRQQLTAEQLRIALEAQRREGQGLIGEWLQNFGFADEHQITAALARQWCCPVLRNQSSLPHDGSLPKLPCILLAGFAMVPVGYVQETTTLYLAFGERVDHGVLYAVEQMTGCHTEPCMAASSFVSGQLRAMEPRDNDEIVFEDALGSPESCRIVASYCARLSASEVRIALCTSYIWIRLFRSSLPPFDLVLDCPEETSGGLASLEPHRL